MDVKITNEAFLKKVESIYGNEYKILESYKGFNTKDGPVEN